MTYLLTYLVPSGQLCSSRSLQIWIFCWWQGHVNNNCVNISVRKCIYFFFLEELWQYGECLSWAIGLSVNQLLSALPHCGPINRMMCPFLCQCISFCDSPSDKDCPLLLYRWSNIQNLNDKMKEHPVRHARTLPLADKDTDSPLHHFSIMLLWF